MKELTTYEQMSQLPNFAKLFPMLHSYATPVKPMTRALIGREKQLRQVKAGLLRPELCNILLLGDAGSGKSLQNGTLIPVADTRGYVNIEQIKIGDYVFDEKGQPVEVLGVYPQGLQKAYAVSFSDKSEIICNDEHLWAVRKCDSNGPYEVMTLREMIDYGICDLSGNENNNFCIPMNKALKRNERIYPIHPYALGVFINDGCISDKDLCVSSLSVNEEVARKVAELIGAIDVEERKSNGTWSFIRPNATDDLKYIQQEEITEKCSFDNIFSTKTTNRCIPREYLYGSVIQRYELLQGLMDTSGAVTSNMQCNCSFKTNSKSLAEDFQELVRSLGMRASLSINSPYDEYVSSRYEIHIWVENCRKYDLFWSSKHKQILVKYLRKAENFNKVYDDLAVCDVRDLEYETEMTCIRVDSESHLFQAGKQHIVTHNTALVQGAMAADKSRIYLEIDISKMIAELRDSNEMAVKIKSLFDESAAFVKQSNIQLVLFIDEFHLMVLLSDAAVEALKPMLADSGTRGVRVIVATTFSEFREHISKNQPLVQRLQRVEVLPPNKETIVSILRSYAKIYGVSNEIQGTYLFEQIIELSDKYIPANSQPRKSILLLDLMVGWYRSEEDTKMDVDLLYKVLKNSEGIELNVKVDAVSIKKRLDSKVFDQVLATSAVAARLQITSADLNNKNKPMASFLFTGSTGVGKSELTKQLAEILFSDPKRLIRFDMTEYSQPSSLERFRIELTSKVWERPYAVILFDEVEKACGDVTRILLQVLDDGRLIDQNNREVSFLNAYIVLTTNAASEIYSTIGDYSNDEDMTDEEQIKNLNRYMKVIRRAIVEGTGGGKFPPELLGRIDAICPFKPLSKATQRKILETRMKKLQSEVLHKHGFRLTYAENDIITYILDDKLDTESDSGGARIVASKFEEEVVIEVARVINLIDRDYKNDDIVGITVIVEGTMATRNKNLLEGDAYVAAYPVTSGNQIIKTNTIK